MTDVVVVGGGATGCGVAWDLALRGVRVTLLEQGALASGTTGRFHGLVHSGGRYAVSDPVAAAQCARESAVLARVAPRLVRRTGGLFVLGADDDPGYVPPWEAGLRAAGVSAREIEAAEALRRVPLLAPDVRRAFLVDDAVCEGPALCAALAAAARSAGAVVREHHRVDGLLADHDGIRGVSAIDARSGATVRVESRLVVVAAGPWAGDVVAGCGITLRLDLLRGAMVALDGPPLTAAVNRLQSPSDGDIALPRGRMTIAGTTSVPGGDPGDRRADDAEVALIRGRITGMLPGLRGAAARHAWSAVRPLYRGAGARDADPGDAHAWSRDFSVLDHASRDGVPGLLSIVGGKLTTFRLMAEEASDAACRLLGVAAPCRTAATLLP